MSYSDPIPASSIDYLFTSNVASQDQIDNLAGLALGRGIDLYTKTDYAGAVKQFKQTTALSLSSDNSSKAFDYMAKAYLQLNKTDDAIKTYKTAIKVFPSADNFHLALGDIYFKNGQLKDAQAEYEKAVRLNYNSADNRYSLGEAYLTSGRLSDAKSQFIKVTQIAPTSATGYYGLGQVLRAMGDNKDAIVQLNKSITMDKTFANSYLELGSAYADMGDVANAQKQLATLTNLKATQQITSLQTYMTKVASPKLLAAYNTNGFITTDGMGTALTDLSSSLSAPNATKDFTMNFTFSKAMDKNSVENVANWQIGRQYGPLISNTYNFGLPVPSTEVDLPAQPTNVVYDSQSNSASVTFTISQNGYGNGTIDPSHVYFLFKGKDTYGKIMDPNADEYSGFSKIV